MFCTFGYMAKSHIIENLHGKKLVTINQSIVFQGSQSLLY